MIDSDFSRSNPHSSWFFYLPIFWKHVLRRRVQATQVDSPTRRRISRLVGVGFLLYASWDAQIAFNSKPIKHHIWMGGVTTQLFSSWCQGTFRSSSFGLTSSFALRKERLGKGQDGDENQITWSCIYIYNDLHFVLISPTFLPFRFATYCTILHHHTTCFKTSHLSATSSHSLLGSGKTHLQFHVFQHLLAVCVHRVHMVRKRNSTHLLKKNMLLMDAVKSNRMHQKRVCNTILMYVCSV